MFRKSVVVATFLVLASPRLFALGLGEIDMQSALNQPMQAVISLTSASSTDLSNIEVSLASLKAHQRAGLSKAAVLSGFRFNVERGEAGGAVVRITGTEPVHEPYLEFLLELEWPKGRLLRQYTVLVDPPVTMPAIPAAPQVPVTRVATPQPARQVSTPAASTSSAPAVAPVAAVTADEYGPIRRSETLWSVAQRVRPGADVSMHQVMQALLRANPGAFVNNNINHMKAGVTLKVPGRDEILSMSAREAHIESRRQYSEWKAANTAAAIPEPPPVVKPSAAETADAPPATDAAQEEAQSPTAETQVGESRLSLVVPEDDSIAGVAAPGETVDAEVEPGSVADLNMQLALATEEAEAGQAQSRELQSRVAELEQQIDTMKRLLELKDDALAQLQDSAGGGAEQEPQPVEAIGADVSEPTPMPADEKPSGIMGRLMDNPLLAGAGVLVAILLGGFLWAANRQKNQAGIYDDFSLEKRLDREAPGDTQTDTPSFNVSEHTWDDSQEQPEHTGEHDALTEADVYLAYGRIQQAEDVLQAALQDDPGNDAYQLKLLDVYHAAGNAAAFEQAASEYRDSVTADDKRWLKVAELGRALAPHNELFAMDADSSADFDMDLSGMDHLPEAGGGDNNLPDSIEFDMDDTIANDEDLQEGILASEDEVTTKLDLARAYIDMDDQESARSILVEVIQEGNAGQKQEAETIIARLA
jgi:pilus assembly protein FimV